MVDRDPSPPRRLRACAPCARVKAKCHFRQENTERHLCDRCEALKRECLPQTTTNLRKPRRIKPNSDSASLEQVLASGVGRNYHGQTNRGEVQSDKSSVKNRPQVERQVLATDPQPPFGLSWPQATHILSLFRQEYTPQFPFVVIRSDYTVESLYEEKPFLFRAVMLVAAPLPGPKIVKMKRNALAFLGYRTLVEEEKTLDILQGVLVIIAWAHKCYVDNDQVINLAYLGLGYAHNLGVTQYPSSSSHRKGRSEISSSVEGVRQEKTHSLEEQRALLGLYCALSIISTRQSRRNPLETPYIDTCLKNIADAQAVPSDTAAAQVIRFIQMSEKLSRGFGEPHERTLSRPYAFLLEGTGRRFRSDLDRLAELTTHPDLASHYHMFELYHQYLLVRLYEPAVVVACHPDEGVSQFVYLLTCLRNCLDAMKTFFDLLLDTPADMALDCSILTVDQAVYVTIQTARLLFIEAPDWDVLSIRESLDFSVVLNKMIACLEQAEQLRQGALEAFDSSACNEGEANEIRNIVKLAQEIRWVKDWFGARLQGQRVEDILPMESGRERTQDGTRPKWDVGLLEDMPWNI